MKKNLNKSLFDITNYQHAALFAEDDFCWEPLKGLYDFLLGLDLGKIEVSIPNGVHLIHPEKISIGQGTIVEPGALIMGPCFIGKDCHVRHGAYLRGGVLTGDRCVLGHCTEVKKNGVFDFLWQLMHYI